MNDNLRPTVMAASGQRLADDIMEKMLKTQRQIVFKMIRKNHAISPSESTHRFPQPTIGKKVPKDSRPTRVDKCDVQISMKTSMLKTIIE